MSPHHGYGISGEGLWSFGVDIRMTTNGSTRQEDRFDASIRLWAVVDRCILVEGVWDQETSPLSIVFRFEISNACIDKCPK
jgi:hypothetical protein